MKWSIKIAEYKGIGVYIHATFWLIIVYVAWLHWSQGQGLTGIISGVIFIFAVFACVVLHEFGHALMAKKYGIRTRDITLLPIGGVARLERMPEKPMQELWVALAGPAVNVVIAIILVAWIGLTRNWQPLNELGLAHGSALGRLAILNVFLVLFNCLPAFPMDGGRVLRALLAMRMDYTRATQIAATIGQGMAILFGLLGFLTPQPFLFFIALFVWIGAAQESSMAQLKSALGGIPVNKAMLTDFRSVSPNDPLDHVIQLVLAGSQKDFPVLDKQRVVAVLTQKDLLKGLSTLNRASLVSEVMNPEFQVLHPAEMLEVAFARLQACQCYTIPVVQDDRLVGLMTMDNLGEFIGIRSALTEPQES